MATYTQYTGTFTKKDGTPRTMNFIKVSDLPKNMLSEGSSRSVSGNGGTTEVVYDVNARGFRTFNHGTRTGNITSKSVNYSFDNRS